MKSPIKINQRRTHDWPPRPVKWIIIAFSTMLLLTTSVHVKAQTANSIAGGLWSNSAIWDCGGGVPCVPGATYDVIIHHAVSVTVGPVNAKTITITNDSGVNASLSLTAGTTTVTGDVTITGLANSNTTDLLMSNTAILNVGGRLLVTSAQTGNMSARISLTNTSQATFSGATVSSYQYQPSLVGDILESQTEINVANSAKLTFTSGFNAIYNSSTKPTTSQLKINIDNTAILDGGALSLKNTEGGSTSNPILLVVGSSAGSAAAVKATSVTLENDDNTAPLSNNRVLFEVRNSSSVRISGRLYLTSLAPSSATGYNRLKSFNSAYIRVDGKITFNSTSGSSNDNRIDMAFSGTGSPTLEMKRNTVNPSKGTYTYGSGSTATAVFSGDTTQVIPTAMPGYIRLRVNNSSGHNLTLAGNTDLSDSLHMVNGIIDTGGYTRFTLGSICLSNEGTSTSYVVNGLTKQGTNSIVLPLGAGAYWAPMQLSNITGGSANLTYFNCNYIVASPSSATTDATFDHVSGREYWNATIVDGGSGLNPPTSADMTFYWKDACLSEINDVSTGPSQDLYIARFNTGTSQWNLMSPSTIDASSQACVAGGSAETGFITATASAYTQFTFAGKATSNNPLAYNALPVELIDFNARWQNNSVLVEWMTASEINNDHFTIERSSDGMKFTTLGKIQGHGTSAEVHRYNFIDEHASSGKNYYRLRQVDFDGRFTLSVVRLVNLISDIDSFLVYPNPIQANETVFFTERANVQVTDCLGIVVGSVTDADHLNTLGLVPGIYLLRNLKNSRSIKLAIK